MSSSLRLQRSFVTACAIAFVAAIPVSCAVGSSPYDIGVGGSIGAGGTGLGGATGTSSEVTSTSGGPKTSSSSSSTTTSGFTTSSSTSSSGGPSSSCDSSDCNTCQGCAQSLPTCDALFTECEFDFGCSDILYCWQCTCSPGDSACLQFCIDQDAGPSADLFNQWASCVVCSCQQTCAIPAGSCP